MDLEEGGGGRQEDAPAEGSPAATIAREATNGGANAVASAGGGVSTQDDSGAAPGAAATEGESTSAAGAGSPATPVATALVPSSSPVSATAVGAAMPTSAQASSGDLVPSPVGGAIGDQEQQAPSSSMGGLSAIPPEGIDWANRWAERENAMINLEAEHHLLRAEYAQLKQQHVDQAAAIASTPQPSKPVVDTKQLEDLRSQLHEARSRAEVHLHDAVAAREQGAKLSNELQAQAAELEKLSRAKLKLQYDKHQVAAEVQPIKGERDRLAREKQEAESMLANLQKELATSCEERDKLFREKGDVRRELGKELEDAKADAAFFKDANEQAVAEQKMLMRKVTDAQESRCQLAEAAAKEKAELEMKLELKEEQIRRAKELQELTQKHVADAQGERQIAKESEAAASKRKRELEGLNAELESKLQALEQKYEEALKQRIPGAEVTAVPDGFSSIADLVEQWSAAREQAMNERQAKEQIRDVLAQVEREVRTRYPVLLTQRDEAIRLRNVAEQLTQHNEGLLRQLKLMEQEKTDAEQRARQAERSLQVLENHTRDISRQLAVLLHENKTLSAAVPHHFVPSNQDADRKEFLSIQDLTDQNMALRKSLAKLTQENAESAQKRSESTQAEIDQKELEYKQFMESKGEEVEALVEAVKRVTDERDDARKKLKDLQAATPAPGEPRDDEKGGEKPKETVLREQLTTVREHFVKCTDALHKEAKDLRISELKLRQDLATTQARLDFEEAKRKEIAEQLAKAENSLDERRQQLKRHEQRLEQKDKACVAEEVRAREAEAQLGQMERDKSHVESQLKAERARTQAAEDQCRKLIVEKDSHEQVLIDLQARVAHESDAYKTMKEDLEASYSKNEKLLRDQLTLSEGRQADLQKSVQELTMVRDKKEKEAADALQSISKLEGNIVRLETQLAERTNALEDARAAAGSLRPRRNAEVASETETQLKRSMDQKDSVVTKLEKELQFAKEREREHSKQVEVWKKLNADLDADKKGREAEIVALQQQMEALQTLGAKHDAVMAKEKSQRDELEVQVQGLLAQASEQRELMSKKEAEIEAAKLEVKKKALDVDTKLQNAERASSRDREIVEEWTQKHRDAITAHSKDIELLQTYKEKSVEMADTARQFQKRCSELEDEVKHVREDRLDEVDALKKRAEAAEQHSKTLADEVAKYQEHLLAVSEKQNTSENSSEAVQRMASEMRRSREMSELKRQELVLDRDRMERSVKVLKGQVDELQRRLDEEQKQVLKLQSEANLKHRTLEKLGELGLLEDDVRRLKFENKSLDRQLLDSKKLYEELKAKVEPLELTSQLQDRREKEWANERKGLNAKVDEWKQMYDEVLLKFDALDVKELTNLRKQSAQFQLWRGRATKEIEKLSEDLKVKSQQAQQVAQVQTTLEEEKKKAADAVVKLAELQKTKVQAEEQLRACGDANKKYLLDLKKAQDLRALRDRKIEGLEEQKKTLIEQHKKELEDLRTVRDRKVDGLEGDLKRKSEEVVQHKERFELCRKELEDWKKKHMDLEVAHKATQGKMPDEFETVKKGLEAELKKVREEKELNKKKTEEQVKGLRGQIATMQKQMEDYHVVKRDLEKYKVIEDKTRKSREAQFSALHAKVHAAKAPAAKAAPLAPVAAGTPQAAAAAAAAAASVVVVAAPPAAPVAGSPAPAPTAAAAGPPAEPAAAVPPAGAGGCSAAIGFPPAPPAAAPSASPVPAPAPASAAVRAQPPATPATAPSAVSASARTPAPTMPAAAPAAVSAAARTPVPAIPTPAPAPVSAAARTLTSATPAQALAAGSAAARAASPATPAPAPAAGSTAARAGLSSTVTAPPTLASPASASPPPAQACPVALAGFVNVAPPAARATPKKEAPSVAQLSQDVAPMEVTESAGVKRKDSSGAAGAPNISSAGTTVEGGVGGGASGPAGEGAVSGYAALERPTKVARSASLPEVPEALASPDAASSPLAVSGVEAAPPGPAAKKAPTVRPRPQLSATSPSAASGGSVTGSGGGSLGVNTSGSGAGAAGGSSGARAGDTSAMSASSGGASVSSGIASGGRGPLAGSSAEGAMGSGSGHGTASAQGRQSGGAASNLSGASGGGGGGTSLPQLLSRGFQIPASSPSATGPPGNAGGNAGTSSAGGASGGGGSSVPAVTTISIDDAPELPIAAAGQSSAGVTSAASNPAPAQAGVPSTTPSQGSIEIVDLEDEPKLTPSGEAVADGVPTGASSAEFDPKGYQ